MVKGEIITCKYCGIKFPHSGRVELQVCPGCGAKLLAEDPPGELPVIRTPGVKYAHELLCNNSRKKIRMMLFKDGVIVSCAFDAKGSEAECCYTSAPGQEEAYFAFQALLADKGYKVMPVEVENGAKATESSKVTPPQEIIERIRG